MYRKLCMCLLLTVGTTFSARAQAFRANDKIVSVGYGLGNLNQAFFRTLRDEVGYNYRGYGPLFAKFEYGLTDRVGLGLNVAHVGARATYQLGDDYQYEAGVDWRNTSALLRLNYHFADHDKLDAYVGTGLGVRWGRWAYHDDDPTTPDDFLRVPVVFPLGFEVTAGVRYFPVPYLGVYAEGGLAKAPLQFGVVGRW